MDTATVTAAIKAFGDATWRLWTGLLVLSLILLGVPAAHLPFVVGKWPIFGVILSGSFLTPFILEQLSKSRTALAAKKETLALEESKANALAQKKAELAEEIRELIVRCPEDECRVMYEAHRLGGTVKIDTLSGYTAHADALCHKGLLLKVDVVQMGMPRFGLGYLYKVPDDVMPILEKVIEASLAAVEEAERVRKGFSPAPDDPSSHS